MRKKRKNKRSYRRGAGILALVLCIAVLCGFVEPSPATQDDGTFSDAVMCGIPSENEPESILNAMEEQETMPDTRADEAAVLPEAESITSETVTEELEAPAEDTEEAELTEAAVIEEASTVEYVTDDGITVSVTGYLPENAGILLSAVPEETLNEIMDKTGGQRPVFAYDITIVDGNGGIWQPEELGAVVNISGLSLPRDEKVKVVHVPDEGTPEQVEVQRSEDTIEFVAEGFSIYVGYTVDFHYNNLTFSLEGNGSVLLSEIFSKLLIDESAANAVSVEFDPGLLAITQLNGDWQLTSLKSFMTPEELTVTFADGTVLKIQVTDPEGEDIYSSGGLKRSYFNVKDGKYYLSADAYSNGDVIVSATGVVIDLNGHSLNMGDKRIIVNDGAELTIIDSNPNSVHYGNLTWNGVWQLYAQGSVPIYGGVICESSGSGSCGFTVMGTLNFNGGTLAGFYSSSGLYVSDTKSAPIYVYYKSSATVNMNGGSIKYCYSSNNTAGIYIKNGGTVNMNAGSITDGKGGTAGAVYVDTNGTFTISGDAYIDNCTKISNPTDRMAYATGNSATINVKDESYIGNCDTYTGNGGNVVIANNAKLNIDMIPLFSHTISSRSISLSDLFAALQGKSSADGAKTFNYSADDVTEVVPKGSGISYDAGTGMITATDLSGEKKLVITCAGQKLVINLSLDIPHTDYAVNGRNIKLSEILSGTGKSAANATAIDFGGDELLMATQLTGDWNIHVNKTASQLSDEWGSVVTKLFEGGKSFCVSFNDGSELFINLTSNNLLNFKDTDTYYFGASKNIETIGNILSAIKGNDKYSGVNVVNVESTETGYISVVNPSGADPWKLKVENRYHGGTWIWVLVEMDDGHEIVLNIQAPIFGEVYMEAIPNVQWYGWNVVDLGNGWVHTAINNSFWFYRSMDSFEGQISYCIQPNWSQNTFDHYDGIAEDYWEDIYDNRTIYDTNTIKILLGRVLSMGYQGNVSEKWKDPESQWYNPYHTDMAQAIATQMLVWEVIVGQRDPNFNHVYPEGAESLLNCLNTDCDLYDSIITWYYKYEKDVQDLSKLPSFMGDNAANPPVYRMDKEGSNYVLRLTDTNKVLDKYTITADKADVILTKEGNTLIVTSPTKYEEIKLTAEANVGIDRRKIVIWHSESLQDTASYTLEFEKDKINGYAKAVNVYTGNLSITKKVDEGTGTASGKTFDFTLTIKDKKGYADFTDSKYMQDASYTGASITSRSAHRIVFSFTLAHDETKSFNNFIPEGAEVTLKENNHQNYSVKMNINGKTVTADSGSIGNMSRNGGTIIVTNTREMANLTVKKAIDTKLDNTTGFPFELTVNGADFTGKELPSGVTRKDGKTNVLLFTLKNGESVSINGLIPKGASVTLKETAHPNYSVKMVKGADTNNSDTWQFELTGNSEVNVTNVPEMANIKVTKSVAGVTDNTTEFPFELTVSDANFTGKTLPSGVTLKKNTTNVLTFKLKNNGSVSINNLIPKNSTVTLKETAHSNYTVKMVKAGNTNDGDTWQFVLEADSAVDVTNSRLMADLTVSKAVSGVTDNTTEFPFELTVNGADFTGKQLPSGVTRKDGKTNVLLFTLKNGESVSINGLIPKDSTVTLKETAHPNYTVKMVKAGNTKESDTWEFTLDSDQSVTVTNTAIAVGSITVKKLVTGTTTEEAFPMELTITDTTGKFDFTDAAFYGRAVIPAGVTKKTVSKSSITFTFSLKHNESVSIGNLVPDGAKVKITETDTKDYTPTIKVGQTSSEGAVKEFTISGTGTTSVEVENNKVSAASIKITKKVTGSLGDLTKKFSFDVEYTNESGEAKKETIELKNGESKTISVKDGTEVKVTETGSEDYTTSFVVNSGTATDGKTVTIASLHGENEVEFTNKKDYKPDTGIRMNSLPAVLVVCIVIAAAAVMFIRRRLRGI